jgi:hypothetical protein
VQHIKRPKLRIITIILALTFLISCNGQVSNVKDPTIDLKEGKLIYSVSGGTASNWELDILFNQKNVLIKQKYARGAGRKYVYEKTTNEILGLYDDVAIFGTAKNQYIIYHTPEKLIKLALSSNYGDTTITKTQEFKEILGYKCQKSIIAHGNQVTVEVWLTDKIKPGIIYPWTPLTFDKVALEYELKILGKTDRKYVIKSISDEPIESSEFEHVVPDDYYLVVPLSQLSIASMWSKSFEENTFQSFSYPYYGNGRESTIEYFRSELKNYIDKTENKSISIDFYINQDGSLSDIEVSINYSKKDKQSPEIKRVIESMPKWTPAKVKGKPVKSKVGIAI